VAKHFADPLYFVRPAQKEHDLTIVVGEARVTVGQESQHEEDATVEDVVEVEKQDD